VAPPHPEETAGVADVAAPDFVQMSAAALWSGGWWRVSLVGAKDISVRVRRLGTVDKAMSRALGEALGRDEIKVRVHIRCYNAAATSSARQEGGKNPP
jgi:hypothetical protein